VVGLCRLCLYDLVAFLEKAELGSKLVTVEDIGVVSIANSSTRASSRSLCHMRHSSDLSFDDEKTIGMENARPGSSRQEQKHQGPKAASPVTLTLADLIPLPHPDPRASTALAMQNPIFTICIETWRDPPCQTDGLASQ